MPVNYLNTYVVALFGGFAAMIAGAVISYTGMSENSYMVYRGMEVTTYYLDKNRHDLYASGLVYSLTFGFALLLLLGVIVIPSPGQIQRRMAASPFAGAPGVGMNGPGMGSPMQQPLAAPEMAVPEMAPLELELEPDLENFDEDDEPALSSNIDDDDADVVYGTGRITDAAHRKFILSSPDSAVKFLMRKELDGRPLKATQDEIYDGWQKRGLSRGKLRKHVLKIMEWESIPEAEVNEIYGQVKNKAFEIQHAS